MKDGPERRARQNGRAHRDPVPKSKPFIQCGPTMRRRPQSQGWGTNYPQPGGSVWWINQGADVCGPYHQWASCVEPWWIGVPPFSLCRIRRGPKARDFFTLSLMNRRKRKKLHHSIKLRSLGLHQKWSS
jgi:hypothetical protein